MLCGPLGVVALLGVLAQSVAACSGHRCCLQFPIASGSGRVRIFCSRLNVW